MQFLKLLLICIPFFCIFNSLFVTNKIGLRSPNFVKHSEDSITPDYSLLQDYLKPAPKGIDAFFGWKIAGGKGDGVRIVIVEDPIDLHHEDFKPPFWYNGLDMDSQGNEEGDHGTSVVGELIAKHNGYGINGICPNALYGLSEVNDTADLEIAIAAAIDTAIVHLRAGDVLLIERTLYGPPIRDIDFECDPTQSGYVPVEYSQECFDAIKRATDKGIIVIEAAGNGEVNLDDTLYHKSFDRKFRDSKAILVAADNGGDLIPSCFTNYGSRIDYFAWGKNIVTTGKGDLDNSSKNEHLKYTKKFGGTSGAAPIIAGVIVQMQGMRIKAGLIPFTVDEIKKKIKGTSQLENTKNKYIGIMPNLQTTMRGNRLKL